MNRMLALLFFLCILASACTSTSTTDANVDSTDSVSVTVDSTASTTVSE